MTRTEIEAALQAAFSQCETLGCSLDDQQQQIILQVVASSLVNQFNGEAVEADSNGSNPLDELTSEQRQTLLTFIQSQSKDQSWKVQLLNDWLQGRESGPMQFIRDLYGPQWLERVQPSHIAQYSEAAMLQVKVGDRIEVSNGLWEWVQDDGPCSREWVPCVVIALTEADGTSPLVPKRFRGYTTCTVCFDNGMEYEIQGIYEWNRYNWRWPEA